MVVKCAAGRRIDGGGDKMAKQRLKGFLTGWSIGAQVKIVLAIHADHPQEPLYGDQLELPRLGDQLESRHSRGIRLFPK